MILVEKTLNILNALSGVNTVLYDSPSMSNFKLDRKEGPFALMYPIVDINDSFTKQNTYRESISIEIFFCDVVKFDADGEQHLAVVDDMYAVAKAFVHQLMLDREITIDGEVKMTTGYGRYDKYVTGVSVECKLVLRQPICLEGDEPEVKPLTITQNGEYNVASIGKVIVNVEEPEPPVPPVTDLFYIKNESQTRGSITVTNGGGTLKYSLDCEEWTDFDFDTHPTISVPAGGYCYFKGVKSNQGTERMNLSMNVIHSIGGNILSIVDETNYESMTNMPDSALRSLFNGDATLIDASLLNFGSLTSVSYFGMASMFQNCTSLVSAPNLSNITSVGSAGMGSMFNNCQSLTLPPDLSNITSVGSSGMGSMFNACIALSIAYAPNILSWNGTANWLNYVPATGTLYCPSQEVSDIIPSGASGCPSGWTKQVIS